MIPQINCRKKNYHTEFDYMLRHNSLISLPLIIKQPGHITDKVFVFPFAKSFKRLGYSFGVIEYE